MNVIKRLTAILNGADVTPRTALEAAVQYVMDHAGGGGAAEPLVVNMTFGENERGETTVTLDVTAADLFEAYEAGRGVVYHSVFKAEDEEEILITVNSFVMVQFNRYYIGDEWIYSFTQWDPEDGTLLVGDELAGTDYVVLTMKETSKSGNAPLETNCTVAIDEQTGKQTITTDLTASDLFSAIEAGKFLALNLTIDEDVIRKIVVVDAQYFDGQYYDFSFTTVDSDDGVICFLAGELSADDAVVFRQI